MSDDRFARLRMKGVIGWPVLAALAVAVLVHFIYPSRDGTMETAASYAFYLGMLAAAVRSCRRAGIAPAEVIGSTPRTQRPWLLAAGFAPLLVLFSVTAVMTTVSIIAGFAPDWASRQASSQEEMDMLARFGALQKALLALNVALLAPMVEEFVFRGLLLRRWLATRRFWPALLGSAALFAILHPPLWLGAFVAGIVLGILYLWSRSLFPSMLLHALNNTVVVVAIASSREPEESSESPLIPLEETGVLIATLIFMLGIGLLIARILRPLVATLRVQDSPPA